MPYDVNNNFSYHKLSPTQSMHISNMREQFKDLARFICDTVEDSREKSLALTKLEETMFWINAAIARNEH